MCSSDLSSIPIFSTPAIHTDCGGFALIRRLILTQIPADANEVIDQLSAQIGTLTKQTAILTSQLNAAMKLIPADVLESVKGDENAED